MSDERAFRKSEEVRATAAERLAWRAFLVSASVFFLLLFPFFLGSSGVSLAAAVVFFGALSLCLLLRAFLVSHLRAEARRGAAEHIDDGEHGGRVNNGSYHHRRNR